MAVPLADKATTRRKPSRRWFQFGLRTLLGLVALSAVVVGVIVPAERQRGAVMLVRSLGGNVEYKSGNISAHVPKWLPTLIGEDYFATVTSVDLAGTPVSDEELEYLNGLSGLRDLYLSDTQVGDAGLRHLKRLKGLRYLFLDGTQISDIGLEQLVGLTRLQLLSLGGTAVSDAGLAHLKGLRGLRGLHLRNTHVSDEGVVKLHPALPDCTLFRTAEGR